MKLFALLRTLIFILFVSVAHHAFAQNSSESKALELLRKMTTSFSTLSYDGVFVHSESINMNSMRVRHDSMDGVEYENLIDLDGDKIEVLRIDDQIVCVYPNKQVASMQMPLAPPFKRFKEVASDRLVKGYQMSVDASEYRIAGREATIVKLIPKDDYRHGHEFWLDKENHFLLKHDMTQKDGTLLERIQFTSVDFSPNLKKEDFIPKQGSYSEHIVESQPQTIKSLWKFEWLPEGFALVWPEARALSQGASMLMVSDGMATVSAFIEPVDQPKAMTLMEMGPTTAGERSIEVDGQLYLFTLVGEVPDKMIEKLMTVLVRS